MPTGKKVFSQGHGAKPTPSQRRLNPQPHRPGVAQPKMASHMKKQPVLPPVYRPQPAPKTVQSKVANTAKNQNNVKVPSMRRQQNSSAVLQPKAGAFRSSVIQLICHKCHMLRGHRLTCSEHPNNRPRAIAPRGFTGNLGTSHPPHGANKLPTKKLGSKNAGRRRRLAAAVANSINNG